MTRFHVVTPNLKRGDAVSQDALGMVQALREEGHEAHVYAQEIDPEFLDQALSIERYLALASSRPADVLIYHHCVAWPQGLELYAHTLNRRVLKYHNVTPARYYEGIHPDYVTSCRQGAVQTRELVRLSAELYLGDSDYNVRELLQHGARNARVLPPFHCLDTVKRLPADRAVLRYGGDDFRNILFVGRIAPNKGHLDLVATFARYHRYLNPRSRLFLVGDLDPRLAAYEQRVRAAIGQAGLHGFVYLTGKVTPSQLKAYYLIAHALLCASHHEGFCVPLVEAMGFQIPCVAWARAAVASTLGPEALLWPDLDPIVLAESLHECLENSAMSDHLVERQQARYERLFSRTAVKARFLRCLRTRLRGVCV